MRRYFSFRGRVARSHYWVYYVIPLYCLGWLVRAVTPVLGWAAWPVLIVLGWANLAGMIKRLHDRDHSVRLFLGALACAVAGAALAGWNQTLAWVVGGPGGIVLGLIMWGMYFMRGTRGDNRYGADPLEGTRGW